MHASPKSKPAQHSLVTRERCIRRKDESRAHGCDRAVQRDSDVGRAARPPRKHLCNKPGKRPPAFCSFTFPWWRPAALRRTSQILRGRRAPRAPSSGLGRCRACLFRQRGNALRSRGPPATRGWRRRCSLQKHSAGVCGVGGWGWSGVGASERERARSWASSSALTAG
jgi:hypothetical protein